MTNRVETAVGYKPEISPHPDMVVQEAESIILRSGIAFPNADTALEALYTSLDPSAPSLSLLFSF